MPFDLTFRTDGAWGTGKGSRLSKVEVDSNFYNLALQIQDLIDNPVVGRSILAVEQSGATFTFLMTDGNRVGPINMPIIAWNWRGEWAGGTSYEILDTFKVTGVGIFMTLQDHIAALTFDEAAEDGSPLAPVYQKLIGLDTIGSVTYDIGFFHSGRVPGGSSPEHTLFSYVAPRAMRFHSDDTESAGWIATAFADDTATLPILKNGTEFGRIVFNTGVQAATNIIYDADTDFAAGDLLSVIEPNFLDTSAEDMSVTLVAERLIT